MSHTLLQKLGSSHTVFGIISILGHIYIIRGQPRFHSSALTADYDILNFLMFMKAANKPKLAFSSFYPQLIAVDWDFLIAI